MGFLDSMEYFTAIFPCMEFNGIKTCGITWKYSILFQGGAERIWYNFYSIMFHKMESNGPLGILIPHKFDYDNNISDFFTKSLMAVK